MGKKKTICLNMIVKNEAHIIEETLSSIYKYIDYYVINDTGSEDNTIEVIRNFFDKKNIKGEIVQHEFRTCKCHTGQYKKYSWFHFGWNRSYALGLCKNKGDYIWVIDADDIIVGDLKLPNKMTAGCYELNIGQGNGFIYQRTQIFKNTQDFNWRYECGLHEYATTDKKNYKKERITGDYFVHSRRLGDRNKDAQLKFEKDVLALKDLINDDPKHKVRYVFYLAQTYQDFGHYEDGIKWYTERTKLGDFYEEVYYSYYRIAKAKEALNKPYQEVTNAYLQAYKNLPSRAEPLYELARYNRHLEKYEVGYTYAKKGVNIPYPHNQVLFISKDVYDYKLLDEMAVNGYYIGKYDEAMAINESLLKNKLVPEDQLERIKQNLNYCKKNIDNSTKKTCVIYFDTIVKNNNMLLELINKLKSYYKIILTGDKLDIYGYDNVTVFDTSTFMKTDYVDIDYLILWNNLSYYFNEKLSFNVDDMLLIQLDPLFNITCQNSIRVSIHNPEYLNEAFNNINNIVCFSDDIKDKLADEYSINKEDIVLTDIDNIYKIFTTSNKYKFETSKAQETNGITIQFPEYIKNIKTLGYINDKKGLISTIYDDIVNSYPNIIELVYINALEYFKSKEYLLCEQQIDNILLRANKSNNTIKELCLLLQARLLTINKQYQESYDLANEVIKRDIIPEKLEWYADEIRDINIDYIKDSKLVYPFRKISSIKNKCNNNCKIMLSMTTCKRYDLFEKTVNSFINCCTDLHLIGKWICVDDNSSEIDRKNMIEKYPFFEYIFKDQEQKGHCKSMNIIRNYAVDNKYDYLIHIEDDWHFIQERKYITESIDILESDNRYGQVLFNRNYTEVEFFKRRNPGGIPKCTSNNLKYIVHEHYETNTNEYKEFINRYQGYGTHAYWPYFSFRPSTLKVKVLEDVGLFSNTGHFELSYAKEYKSHGYISVFMNTFSAIHIGKKTWEKDVKNSYDMNNEKQFTNTNTNNNINIDINIIYNNDFDTWKQFKNKNNDKLPKYNKCEQRNITSLSDYEKKIFFNNDFNYNRSIISKIMLYIDLFRNNNKDYILILNDNVELKECFWDDINSLIKVNNSKYDITTLESANNSKLNYFSLEKTNGWIITKEGANKILKYIDNNNIKNINFIDNIINLNIFVHNKPLYDITQNLKEWDTSHLDSSYKLDGYTFYSQLDSFGNDISYSGKLTIQELKKICDDDSNAIGFNTLGYIKHKLDNIDNFIYLPQSKEYGDGIYVKNVK